MNELMDGITMLATEDVYGLPDWPWFVFIGITLLGFVIGVVIEIISGERNVAIACFFLGMLVGGIIAFSLAFVNQTYDYTQYKVLIDEEVNLLEFREKFRIISQEGDIYTIVPKS